MKVYTAALLLMQWTISYNLHKYLISVVSRFMPILKHLHSLFSPISVLPHITSVDVTPNPHVGEPFFIECSVDGIPMPKTAWTKDGTMLEEAQVLVILKNYNMHELH